jgi:hypothetical protein
LAVGEGFHAVELAASSPARNKMLAAAADPQLTKSGLERRFWAGPLADIRQFNGSPVGAGARNDLRAGSVPYDGDAYTIVCDRCATRVLR